MREVTATKGAIAPEEVKTFVLMKVLFEESFLHAMIQGVGGPGVRH